MMLGTYMGFNRHDLSFYPREKHSLSMSGEQRELADCQGCCPACDDWTDMASDACPLSFLALYARWLFFPKKEGQSSLVRGLEDTVPQ